MKTIDGIQVETAENGRHKDDLYMTQEPLTKALIERVSIKGVILESCAGYGHIARVLRDDGLTVFTNDIAERPNLDFMGDAADPSEDMYNTLNPFDFAITNPPYNQAFEILQTSYERARIGVAMLLRLSFLEPANVRSKRGDWLQAHTHNLSDMIIFSSPRPSFTDGGTDSVTVAWFVWRKYFRHEGMGTRMHFVTGWK